MKDSRPILSLPQYVLVKEIDRKIKLSHHLNHSFQRVKDNYNTKMGLQNKNANQSKTIMQA